MKKFSGDPRLPKLIALAKALYAGKRPRRLTGLMQWYAKAAERFRSKRWRDSKTQFFGDPRTPKMFALLGQLLRGKSSPAAKVWFDWMVRKFGKRRSVNYDKLRPIIQKRYPELGIRGLIRHYGGTKKVYKRILAEMGL
jgi:hypothetical protein